MRKSSLRRPVAICWLLRFLAIPLLLPPPPHTHTLSFFGLNYIDTLQTMWGVAVEQAAQLQLQLAAYAFAVFAR